MEERKNSVTLNRKAVTLIGPEIKTGQKAPDFILLDTGMKEITLSSSHKKIRVFSVTYSLETPVCDLQTRTFEEYAGSYPDAVMYAVSMDLPFTQKRYYSANNLHHLKLLSDYREASFGAAYGVLIKESRLLARAVFIVDADDIVRYAEYVKDVTMAPDYEAALAALKVVTYPPA